MAPHHELSASPTRDWDAATYDRVSDPMVRWAEPVLDRLPPADRAALAHAVATGLPAPVVDYVRLDIVATRGGG